ncbi:tigger transposable element-derived protein 1-like [Onthophagus taurus]|uniref:tigger transposable element-derived protein 1-like n=1 Tax=Onthophagus taurus TaxID=166361 RepID=UPI0039BDACD9
MSRRTFIARDEKVFPGFKAAKGRLMLMLRRNTASDCKLKPLLVYRSENPRALKNKYKSGLPVIWKSNQKAWVTASLFEDWFRNHFVPEVERYCSSKNIAFNMILLLIIDNAPGHSAANLMNYDPRVKVMFLPPNTTSLLQSIYQGVIKRFKAYYTRRSFRRLNESMNHDNLYVKKKEIINKRIVGRRFNENIYRPCNNNSQIVTYRDNSMEIVLLPPNITSLIQPMDQGVIANFKAHYLRRTFQRLIDKTKGGNKETILQFWKKYNILDVIGFRGHWARIN